MQPPRATASEDNVALGSLQASPQAPGQTTGVAGACSLINSVLHEEEEEDLKSGKQPELLEQCYHDGLLQQTCRRAAQRNHISRNCRGVLLILALTELISAVQEVTSQGPIKDPLMSTNLDDMVSLNGTFASTTESASTATGNFLNRQKRGMENSLYDAKHWHDIELQNLGSVISKLEAELGEIRGEVDHQKKDYETLLNNRMKLELEIGSYHGILDGEESRFLLLQFVPSLIYYIGVQKQEGSHHGSGHLHLGLEFLRQTGSKLDLQRGFLRTVSQCCWQMPTKGPSPCGGQTMVTSDRPGMTLQGPVSSTTTCLQSTTSPVGP
ncbi:UNVERIFIED_CONTAM: hypothetical protein FKN15_045555 [Acipenser sinensis]